MGLFDDAFSDMEGMFNRAERQHQKRRDEFAKCAADPPARSAEVGDRVLVNAGVVGRGFECQRLEATVLEVADTAYHVQYAKTDIEFGEGGQSRRVQQKELVHRFAVTDVLGPPTALRSSTGQGEK